MREALRVRLQFAICIARAVLPTIVDVDVDVCNTANWIIVRNQSQTRRGSGRPKTAGVVCGHWLLLRTASIPEATFDQLICHRHIELFRDA